MARHVDSSWAFSCCFCAVLVLAGIKVTLKMMVPRTTLNIEELLHIFLLIPFQVATLLTSGIEFGNPGVPLWRPCKYVAGLLLCAPLIFESILSGTPHEPSPEFVKLLQGMSGLAVVASFTYVLRGVPLQMISVCVVVRILLGPQPQLGELLSYILLAVSSSFTRYLCDQRLAFVVGILPFAFGKVVQWATAHNIETNVVLQFCYLGPLIILACYMVVVMRRTRRHFPAGLRGARFVRLGYLRDLAARGGSIKRCQELPEEAFGNPAKAKHLVVVSHRWLDPRSTDVSTDRFPQGMKLASLLEKLESNYWSKSWCSRSSWVVGGWDVLIFFDFMSLPQEGVDEDGLKISRTAAETAVFEECLPLMSTLYSMFPVLVLDEVPEGKGFHSYHESGWCTCELIIAALGKQLRKFSANVLASEMTCPITRRSHFLTAHWSKFDICDAKSFLEKARLALEDTHFSCQSDRLVVLGIIRRCTFKRVLADAVKQRDLALLRSMLAELSSEDCRSIMEEPIDAKLNTLLHAAVIAGNTEACSELLRHGARASARNLHGDTPSQWYCFSRCSSAAAVCRAHRKLEARKPGNKKEAFKTAETDLEAGNALGVIGSPAAFEDASAAAKTAAVSELEEAAKTAEMDLEAGNAPGVIGGAAAFEEASAVAKTAAVFELEGSKGLAALRRLGEPEGHSDAEVQVKGSKGLAALRRLGEPEGHSDAEVQVKAFGWTTQQPAAPAEDAGVKAGGGGAGGGAAAVSAAAPVPEGDALRVTATAGGSSGAAVVKEEGSSVGPAAAAAAAEGDAAPQPPLAGLRIGRMTRIGI